MLNCWLSGSFTYCSVWGVEEEMAAVVAAVVVAAVVVAAGVAVVASSFTGSTVLELALINGIGRQSTFEVKLSYLYNGGSAARCPTKKSMAFALKQGILEV